MLRAILVDAEGRAPSGHWVDSRQPALCRARRDRGGHNRPPFSFLDAGKFAVDFGGLFAGFPPLISAMIETKWFFWMKFAEGAVYFAVSVDFRPRFWLPRSARTRSRETDLPGNMPRADVTALASVSFGPE
jgi:hypothetical protein